MEENEMVPRKAFFFCVWCAKCKGTGMQARCGSMVGKILIDTHTESEAVGG